MAEGFNIFPSRDNDTLIIQVGHLRHEVHKDVDLEGLARALKGVCNAFLEESRESTKRTSGSEEDVEPLDSQRTEDV